MRIGAHISTAGGISKAIARAQEIGCETIQIFGSSPQSWAFKPVAEAEKEAYRQGISESGLGPVFLHAIYLINLGTPDPAILEKGVRSLIDHMGLAADIGAAGLIFHPGSHKGAGFEATLPQIVAAIKQVLENSPEGPYLVVENMAGMGQHIGARFQELGGILESVDSPRLKVCLDTQHTFAAGYDLTTARGIEITIAEFDELVGVENLVAVHANDSKRVLGSGVDRHDNIGEGYIGEEGFEMIMGNPVFRDVPFFLEVPGLEGKGPDSHNIQILKNIRQRVGLYS
ncbi:MAG: deoxyribonuclease IV [Chloroflexi bacterium]|nr:deoxyribonuclease IV [Chloroflexota bacterium]MCI0845562.1 deoxyribonuclease IV [Chloroflexota bacterium]